MNNGLTNSDLSDIADVAATVLGCCPNQVAAIQEGDRVALQAVVCSIANALPWSYLKLGTIAAVHSELHRQLGTGDVHNLEAPPAFFDKDTGEQL